MKVLGWKVTEVFVYSADYHKNPWIKYDYYLIHGFLYVRLTDTFERKVPYNILFRKFFN